MVAARRWCCRRSTQVVLSGEHAGGALGVTDAVLEPTGAALELAIAVLVLTGSVLERAGAALVLFWSPQALF